MINLKQVKTEDGSITYYNESAREHYHTLAGAIQEAKQKHVEPSKNFIKNNSVIVDFCFGLGYNSFVAMEYAESKKIKIEIIALENDIKIIQEIKNINLDEKYEKFRKMWINLFESTEDSNNNFKKEKQIENFKLTLILGDAKKSITNIKNADVVFFDPFSLKKTPEMWDFKVFESVYNAMSKNSILTTYSCSKQVRNNMVLAKFKVEDGPIFGRKAPGTLAYKNE